MNSDFAFYFELFKKRIPVMAVIFTLCTVAGLAVALTLPPRYSADATLLVEGAQIPSELVERLETTAASEQLQILEQRLMTRANLIDLARKFQVFAGESGLKPDEVVERMKDQTNISMTGGRDAATIMTISFDALSPTVAANVVNEFVTLVLAADAERRLGQAGQTVDFFEQQVKNLDEVLSKQSAQIVAFKNANKDALPEGFEYRLDRQSALQERLNLSARELASLRDQKARFEALGSAESSTSAISPLRQQLAAAQANLSGLRGTLAENNPRLVALRERIQSLEQRIAGNAPVDLDQPNTGSATVLELQLAEIGSSIKFLEEEMVRTEAEIAEIRSAIERTPPVAIRLEELEREYENTQARYADAVNARSKAQTGEIIQTSAKGERITPIEQAVVPDAPTSPNRKLIAGGGMFAGGALAAFFFVLTELLNRSIRRPVDLVRGLGVQPLATIPYIELPGERRKRRALTGLVVVLIIAAIAACLWAVHTQYMPLDLLFDRVIERIGL
ncbi:MAG: lipopolysaccharide biosynthesis [Paracoccaceae bacterium]